MIHHRLLQATSKHHLPPFPCGPNGNSHICKELIMHFLLYLRPTKCSEQYPAHSVAATGNIDPSQSTKEARVAPPIE